MKIVHHDWKLKDSRAKQEESKSMETDALLYTGSVGASQNIHWEKCKDPLVDFEPNQINLFRVVLPQIFKGNLNEIRHIDISQDISKLYELQLERLKLTRMTS